ncbi:MAG: glycosyltransferase family 4 protein [Chitinophagaceae bacterium]|nr:glycosyltransferase family 4 protein [Chitinophagaceae bacterium]
MNILFIAPIPPPITGHSIVSKVLLDELVLCHDVTLVNMSKNNFEEGADGIKRFYEVFKFLKQVFFKKNQADTIYLTISESLSGNIKDILIYLICYMKLNKLYIHLHGGSIKRKLWDHYPLIHRINKFFLKRIAGVIISGESHSAIFNGIVSTEKIYIVPNFSPDYLFLNKNCIIDKFDNVAPLRILYMSNLIPKKGYMELVKAFFHFTEIERKQIQIDFAGAFGSEKDKDEFLRYTKGVTEITYHGVVDDTMKRSLFFNAHIFCLPTAYYEGQPISILEAYASGCVVLTTGQSGILDIFKPGQNGLLIKEKDSRSIADAIKAVINKSCNLLEMALLNNLEADIYYRTVQFQLSMRNILEQGRRV